jgi:hypothetical protein
MASSRFEHKRVSGTNFIVDGFKYAGPQYDVFFL